MGFWRGLEKYIYKRIEESRLRWGWVGVLIVVIVLGMSIASGYFTSSPLFGGKNEMVRWAARAGDYGLADTLYRQYQLESKEYQVLGAETELEELVYPERKIEHEILKREELLIRYPGYRDLLINLSELYKMAGEQERAAEYWEQARILDPNNEIFK